MIKRNGTELVISRITLEDIVESYNPEIDVAPPLDIPIDLAELALHSLFNDTSLRFRHKDISGAYFFSFREQELQRKIFGSGEAKDLIDSGAALFVVDYSGSIQKSIAPSMSLNEWASHINAWGMRKGWDFDFDSTPEKLMLMCCEIAEAMEEYRNVSITVDQADGKEHIDFFYSKDGKPEGIAIELIDCIIRILHYLGKFDLDADKLMRIKMEYNNQRSYRHGNLRA